MMLHRSLSVVLAFAVFGAASKASSSGNDTAQYASNAWYAPATTTTACAHSDKISRGVDACCPGAGCG